MSFFDSVGEGGTCAIGTSLSDGYGLVCLPTFCPSTL